MKVVIIIARRDIHENIKEILRLASAGDFSASQIAKSCSYSPCTITAIRERVKTAELEVNWSIINQMSNGELDHCAYAYV